MWKGRAMEALLDWARRPRLPVVRREGSWRTFPGKATAIIGVRRCGKSILLEQIAEDWKRERAGRDWWLICFSDERLSGIRGPELGAILEAIGELREAEGIEARETYLLLDELQEVPGWEPFVDRLVRTPGFQVAISGSSAKLLSREIATQMRGRAITQELFPFSLVEAASLDGQRLLGRTPGERAKARKVLRTFLETGGFPEAWKIRDDEGKRLVLSEYLDVLLFRDVVERNDFSSPATIRQAQRLLFGQFASPFTANRLIERLRATGHRIDKNLVPEILAAFEDAFALFLVPIFSESAHQRQVNPRKVYLADSGWAWLAGHSLREDGGRFLENAVFVELRRRGGEIAYGKTRGGREVDFLHRELGSARPKLYQVAWSIQEPETRRREIAALEEMMRETGAMRATLVTFEESEQIRLSRRREISVLPFADWVVARERGD